MKKYFILIYIIFMTTNIFAQISNNILFSTTPHKRNILHIPLSASVFKLFEAVISNDTNKIEKLLDLGININSRDFSFRTPMMHATDNSLDAVTLLLRRGGYLNTRDNQGNTLLMIASEKGYTKLVQYLLKHDVLIDSVNSQGISALYLAVQNGHTKIVNLLLAAGANLNKTIPKTLPLLLEAIKYGYIDIILALLKYGADPNTIHPITKTPAISIVGVFGSKFVVNELIKAGADVNYTNRQGVTPLMLVTIQKDYDIMELLLKNGADANIKNSNGKTAEDFVEPEDKRLFNLLEKYN